MTVWTLYLPGQGTFQQTGMVPPPWATHPDTTVRPARTDWR
jgi:hypothetical protein